MLTGGAREAAIHGAVGAEVGGGGVADDFGDGVVAAVGLEVVDEGEGDACASTDRAAGEDEGLVREAGVGGVGTSAMPIASVPTVNKELHFTKTWCKTWSIVTGCNHS